MTRREALKHLKAIRYNASGPKTDALNMAIDALSKIEPSNKKLVKHLKFHVYAPGDHSVGISSTFDEITVTFTHGEPLSNLEDLVNTFRQPLADYYDTAVCGIQFHSNKKDCLVCNNPDSF